MSRFASITLALLLLAAAGSPARAADEAAGTRFDALVRSYVEGLYAAQPSFATYMGVHEHDDKLETMARKSIEAETARIRRALGALEKLDRAALDETRQIDYDLFLSSLRSHLFQVTHTRSWENDPGSYNYGWALENLIARDFAPAERRLRSVIARLRLVPERLANARKNLKKPPRLFTEFAAEDFEGMIGYLDADVPKAFASMRDSALWREYAAAKIKAQDATRDHVRWLREKLLPRSTGSYVLGEATYRKRLLHDEMIDLPIDTILAAGARELTRLKARYRDAAARIAPGAPVDSVVSMMRRDHPTREGLLDEVRALLGDLRDFCVSSKFIALPSDVPLAVRATPEYAASRSFASFDGPGPLETQARDAYYNVTVPAASWDSARTEQHLQGYSRWTLPTLSIHECYPGHYVHFLYMPQAPTLARKTMGSGAFGEGWGLYAEEALLDHGYGNRDPKLEFGMLRWALVRSCRLQVGLRVHTRGMTMEQATAFFMENAGMERPNAEREAFRAAFDPLYIVYTVGAMQIRKLRDDLRAKEGSSFDLARFHAAILSQGSLPVVLLRRILLHDSGPTL